VPDRGRDAADVLIAGGGVAALEAMMALADLAGERARVTLVAPEPDFVHRPQSVAEPFGLGAPQRRPLAQIASGFGAGFRRAGVAAVDPAGQRVVLRSGDTLGYDVLVLAPGARTLPAFEDAVTFGGPGSAATMRALLADLEGGEVGRIAFVAPTLAGWTLPLYELALLTARHAARRGIAAELVLVTPEATPLQAFGSRASQRVGALLADAGVEFAGGQSADAVDGALRLSPSGRTLDGRVVALPLVRGPRIDGVPTEPPFGFIPVDDHGRVRGLPHVYAAGDATHHLVKQGGLAAQQADAVAAQIAARLGAPVLPEPYRPVLRGVLETGDERHVLHDDGQPAKLAGRHLAPYLDALQPAT
jgi:sulfide:quinone oxidoreductase